MRAKGLATLMVVGLLVLLLSSCGASEDSQSFEPAATAAREVTIVESVEVEKEVVAAPTAPPASAALPGDTSAEIVSTSYRATRMIIKDAEIELLVLDTDVALDSVTLIATEYGGYIVGSHTWLEGEYKHATVRLGVPAEEFENVLRRLRSLALEVTNEVASGEDVTDQYVDLQSRLTNLQATRDRIREFLNQAATVEEALKVNEQLSEIEGQIEEIQGRLNYLKDRAAYSTIDVTLRPEVPTPTVTPTSTPAPTPTPTPWLPGETVAGAVDLMGSISRGLVTALIWIVIGFGPFLLGAGLLIWLGVRWRRSRRKPKAKAEGKPKAKAEGTPEA